MIHDYEPTIAAIIEAVGVVLGLLLSTILGIVAWLAKQNYSLRLRIDSLEDKAQMAFNMLNSVGQWIKNGHDARFVPILPTPLIEHVPEWPSVQDMVINDDK